MSSLARPPPPRLSTTTGTTNPLLYNPSTSNSHSSTNSNTDNTTTTTTTTKNTNPSILSEKVARAVQVRTDTPAMKAALEALSHLAAVTTATTTATSSTSSSTTTIDSRSVRVAIEQDALHQALLLQDQLRYVVHTVRDLRASVAEIAALAHAVTEAIHTNVITNTTTTTTTNNHHHHQEGSSSSLLPSSPGMMMMRGETTGASASAGGAEGTDSTTRSQPSVVPPEGAAASSSSSSLASSHQTALQEEQRLAALLSEAFLCRNINRQRLQAVQAFLEQFDLSPEDSRLLDHYAFEDVSAILLLGNNNNSSNNSASASASGDANKTANNSPNGLAFLRALHRVRHIRRALVQTFGSTSDLADTKSASLSHEADRRGLGASSALRMMESLAQQQERAYERLYHWLQKCLHVYGHQAQSPQPSVGGGADPHTTSASGGAGASAAGYSSHDTLDEALQHPFVKRALFTLRHVPAFYSHTLELVASSRRAEETRRFLLALTNGYDGLAPIEMKSHDSVAYVGDMLAFAFKAFSVEADVAKGLVLFVPDDEKDDEQQHEPNEQEEQDETGEARRPKESLPTSEDSSLLFLAEKPMSASEMLSISMGGLARPLKSRILQVIATLSRRPDEDEDHHDETRLLGHRRSHGSSRHHHDGDDGSDDAMHDDFEEEGSATRHRLKHLYEICGLLLFYKAAMEKGLRKLEEAEHSTATMTAQRRTSDDDNEGERDESMTAAATTTGGSESNRLVACLYDCLVEATKAYEATIRVYGAMLDQLASITGESEATLAHSMMILLVDVRLTSPGFSTDVECPAECQHTLSIEWVTETLLHAGIKACKVLDDTVTLKQLVAASRKAGMGVLSAEMLHERIDRKEAELIEQVVENESSKVLDLCGLGPISSAFRRWKDVQQEGDEPQLMSSYPGLSPEEVESCMKEFYASLYSPPLPSLDTAIKDPLLRKTTRSKIATRVCETYGDLYGNILSSGKGGYDDVSFLGHTPEQVQQLLSV